MNTENTNPSFAKIQGDGAAGSDPVDHHGEYNVKISTASTEPTCDPAVTEKFARTKISNDYRAMIEGVIEQTCIKRIEEIEGRVPDTDEIKANGNLHLCEANGIAQYAWKGQPICQFEPAGFSPSGWRDAKVMEISPRLIQPVP